MKTAKYLGTLVCILLLVACGGGGGGKSGSRSAQPADPVVPVDPVDPVVPVDPPQEPIEEDIVPDPFTFQAINNAPLNSLVVSSPIRVTGINQPIPVSIDDGEYSINGNTFTCAPGLVQNNDEIRVRLTTAGLFGLEKKALLDLGGIKGAFSATTLLRTLAWQAPESIESYDYRIETATTTVDDEGVVTVVMRGTTNTLRDSSKNLLVNSFSLASGWKGAVSLNNSIAADGVHMLRHDASGNLLLLWRAEQGTSLLNTYNKANGTWSEEKHLSSSSYKWLYQTEVQGNRFLILFTEDINDVTRVALREIDVTSGQDNTEILATYPQSGYYGQPTLYMDSTQTMHLVWQDGRSVKHKQRPANTTQWSNEKAITTLPEGAQIFQTNIAETSSGLEVVFKCWLGSQGLKVFAHLGADGHWQTKPIPNFWHYVRHDDVYTFVYHEHQGDTLLTLASQFHFDTGVQDIEIIRSEGRCDSVEEFGYSTIASDIQGRIILTAHTCQDWAVWASVFSPGEGWSTPQQLSTYLVGGEPYAKITIAETGHAQIIWTAAMSTAESFLFTSELNADGSWTPEKQLNESGDKQPGYINPVFAGDGLHLLWSSEWSNYFMHNSYSTTRFDYRTLTWSAEKDLRIPDPVESAHMVEGIPLPTGEMLGIFGWYTGSSVDIYARTYR